MRSRVTELDDLDAALEGALRHPGPATIQTRELAIQKRRIEWHAQVALVALSGWKVNHKLAMVALYAARIRYWAKSVEQAHLFGNSPGEDDEPWELPFQKRAARVYRVALPSDYLEGLCAVFLGCSLTMEDHAIPGSLSGDWKIVLSYLANASEAIAAEFDFDLFPTWEDPSGSPDPTTPAVVRFDLLASFVTSEGVRRLRDAAANVAQSLVQDNSTDAPLSELQLEIISDLAHGDRVIDIARARGYSTRSLYRELAAVWSILGVANRQQGISMAAENGWLD